jgi:poly-beta-1,6-N-acetyl-D-glucosamine synthase
VEIFNIQLDPFIFVMLLTFVICFLIQVLYYFIVYGRVAGWKSIKSDHQKQPPVSIVICAKDEVVNLENNLPLILGQDYPAYEVVVVNDCSSDETEHLLDELKLKYAHLRTTTIKEDEKFPHGKKLALTIGIKAAKFDHLLMTDADCRPAGNKWLSTMQDNFSSETEIVLGYGKFEQRKGLLNKVIRYDTFFVALNYLGFALAKLPYMGVGRNLAYKKDIFFRNKGFASHFHLLSGDDDLFVNEVANKKNTCVELSPCSFTISTPKTNWKSWCLQKSRHFTTSGLYKFYHKVVLGLEVLTRELFYLTFFLLLISDALVIFVLSVFFVRFLIQFIIFKKAMKKLDEKKILLPSFVLDFVMPWVQLAIILSSKFSSKRNKWK